MITSVFGVWRGNIFKGLSDKMVLGKLVLVNETKERIVYSPSKETSWGGVSAEIAAEPGEAICFVDPEKETSRVAVGPEAEIQSWVRYYFYDPHLIPDPSDITIENCYLVIKGVSVTAEVLRSYKPEVAVALQKILRGQKMSCVKEAMVDILLSRMGRPHQTGGKK